MSLLLQVWGGTCYLLNKVFFSKAERAVTRQKKEKWKQHAWIVYLLGLPPWVFIFISERNWIAAAIESSGVPSMIMGLVIARHGHVRNHGITWLDHLAKLMILVGMGLSFYDFGFLATLNQFFELGIAAGFLMGTYLLAKSIPQGYFWFALGNISAAALMFRQEYYILMAQQILSLGLVLDAYAFQRRREREKI